MTAHGEIFETKQIIAFDFDRDYVDFIRIEIDRFDQPMTRTLASFLRRRYGDDYWYCVDISGDGHLDGYVLGGKETENDLDVVHVYSIAIRQEFEGQGWAKKLMSQLISNAKTNNIDAIILEVRENNNRAHQFYLSLGFKETRIEKNYYDNSVDAICMMLDLILP